MLKKSFFPVTIVSLILLIYCTFINFKILLPIVYFIFGISPFLLVWVVYAIIRFDTYKGKEFSADEEWGYQDKNKEDLDIL
jgi:hypothetical protein